VLLLGEHKRRARSARSQPPLNGPRAEKKSDDLGQWEKTQKVIAALPSGESLIARTMHNFATLRQNIETVVVAVAEKLKNQPEGDQPGPIEKF
jgi:hypothetical protein